MVKNNSISSKIKLHVAACAQKFYSLFLEHNCSQQLYYGRLFKICFFQQFAMGMTIIYNENDIRFHY